MNRKLWTILMLSVALLGQTAASALPSTCAATNSAAAHPTDTAMSGTSSHNEHTAASSEAGEKECCTTGIDTECGMSGCLLSGIPSSSQPVDSAEPHPGRLVSHIPATPPNPIFPLFRPPIA